RHTRSTRDWSSDVCSSDLEGDLRMLHNEAGTFVDVTTFPVDIVNNVICGQVQSLSDFVVAFMTGCPTDGECDDSNPCTSDVCARSEERRVGKWCDARATLD